MKIPGITTHRMESIFSRRTHLNFSNEAFTLKAIANRDSHENCVGIITGKKAIGKQAVIRNRADRRIKAAIGTLLPQLKVKGYDFLVFSKPPSITLPWKQLVSQAQQSFQQFEHASSKMTKKKNHATDK